MNRNYFQVFACTLLAALPGGAGAAVFTFSSISFTDLRDADGSAASDSSSLMIVVADTNQDGLSPLQAYGPLGLGSVVGGGGDDVVVLRIDRGNFLTLIGGDGALTYTHVGSPAGNPSDLSIDSADFLIPPGVGDSLHFVWLPDLEVGSNLVPVGTVYGTLGSGFDFTPGFSESASSTASFEPTMTVNVPEPTRAAFVTLAGCGFFLTRRRRTATATG